MVSEECLLFSSGDSSPFSPAGGVKGGKGYVSGVDGVSDGLFDEGCIRLLRFSSLGDCGVLLPEYSER